MEVGLDYAPVTNNLRGFKQQRFVTHAPHLMAPPPIAGCLKGEKSEHVLVLKASTQTGHISLTSTHISLAEVSHMVTPNWRQMGYWKPTMCLEGELEKFCEWNN